MQNAGLVLLVFAFVFAVIAAGVTEGYQRWHFGWGAIAFWLAAELFGGIGRLLH